METFEPLQKGCEGIGGRQTAGKIMKALSIKQPYVWAIMNAGKDIENRDWSTKFRGTVAIHASKGLTLEDYVFGIYSINEILDYELALPQMDELERGVIVGTVEIVDCVSDTDSLWFFGDYGFVLKNPRKLFKPVQCKGALGFWEVPTEIENQMKFSKDISVTL